MDVLASTLRILGVSSSLADVQRQYFDDSREAKRRARKYKSDGVMIELLLSILIHKNRVHKSLVFYVFSQLCALKRITVFEVQLIVQVNLFKKIYLNDI